MTGSSGAGTEAVIANFVDPGDRVVCGVAGMLGERLAGAMTRPGAELVRVEGTWGRAIPPERLVAAVRKGCDVLAVVHGESSTGVAQTLDGLGHACREAGALLVVVDDTVAAARHAAAHGWVGAEAVGEVAGEKSETEGRG